MALQEALDEDRVSPLMTMKEASNLAAELDPREQSEPEENLDYFVKKLAGYFKRQIDSIGDEEIERDLMARLLALLQHMADASEEPMPRRSRNASTRRHE